jgi:divalent metal cation (Fe/Co/Zn/Cd) transporter
VVHVLLVPVSARTALAERGVTREHSVRRGQWLTWLTILYNSIEALVALFAGALAGSVALVGFGLDSVIEVSASAGALWRLRHDADLRARERAERHALRLIGMSFLALAAWVAFDAARALFTREAPEASPLGIAIASLSVVVMPLLARAKRRVAAQLSSSALTAEARQTDICMYLSITLLIGLALNAWLGWWWADPAAALVMVPLIAYEGREALAGRTVCAHCAPAIAD